ncbi:MAG: DUF262 domain-containing protein [Bacteroidales bacterium]
MKLLKGEQITFTHLEVSSIAKASDEEINQKYIKGEVRIVTEQARYPLPSIVTMIDSDDYQLNPEFQRRHRWNNIQKSRLIESFIMNVPIPPIFLYEDKYSHYEVMDGLQRLTAIYHFYTDKLILEGLEQWPELNGKSCTTLPVQIRKGIDRRYLSSIILLQETAKDEFEAKKLKQLVFERINSGGVKLKPQESRNAIFNGPLNELCIKLGRNKFLCRTWNIPEPNGDETLPPDDLLSNDSFREMEDVELVLRFFANRQREELFKSSINFSNFLDNYLRYGNHLQLDTLKEMTTIFENTIEFIYNLFGEKAFWLFRQRNNKWNWYQRPTTAVFDSLMLVATKHLNCADIILKKQPMVDDMLSDFYKLNYTTFEGRNTNPSILKERENKFDAFFEQLIK